MDNNVIKILNNLNSITNSAVLRYPVTVLNSPSSDVRIKIDMSKLGPKFNDIGVYDLNYFLNAFSLHSEDRTVQESNSSLTVTDSSGAVSVIRTDEIDNMKEYDTDPIAFDKTKNVDTVSTFELDKDIFNKIKSASRVYKHLEDLKFQCQDNILHMELTQTDRFNSTSDLYRIQIQSVNTKEFKLCIPVVNFNSIPAGNYGVTIKYNANANAYRIMLFSKDIPGVEIILSQKA